METIACKAVVPDLTVVFFAGDVAIVFVAPVFGVADEPENTPSVLAI